MEYDRLTHGQSEGHIARTNNTMTLPRDLWLDESDGSVRQAFVPELRSLRQSQYTLPAAMKPPGGGVANASMLGVAGKQLEIVARFRMGAGGVIGLTMLSSKLERCAAPCGLHLPLCEAHRTRWTHGISRCEPDGSRPNRYLPLPSVTFRQPSLATRYRAIPCRCCLSRAGAHSPPQPPLLGSSSVTPNRDPRAWTFDCDPERDP